MTQESIERLVAELKAVFPDARSAREGTQTLVRLPSVSFPKGCRPAASEALVVLDPQAPPQLHLKVIPTRSDGGTPRSTGTTTIAGESWCTFSFNLQWDENRHSGEQFVLGRLRRFALNE